MKVVNPIGRAVEAVNSSANYISPLAGCICSGPDGTAASYRSQGCTGACLYGDANRDANYELAKNA